jgi:methyl-accepting chemotaxis protein
MTSNANRSASIYTSALKAGIATLSCTAVCGLVGMAAILILGNQLASTQHTASVLRNHLEADMMHDALRSDVMSALSTNNTLAEISLEDVRADLNEHVAHFKEMLDNNLELTRGGALEPIIKNLEAPLTTYIAAANQIVGAAGPDMTAASTLIPKFYQAFGELEGTMSTASDEIQTASASAASFAAFVGIATLVVMALAAGASIIVVVTIIFATRKQLIFPIVDLTSAMDRVAGGDLNTEAPHRSRDDEIGRMAEALSKFRENAHKRAALEAEQRAIDDKQKLRAKVLAETAADFADHMATSVRMLREASRLLASNSMDLEAVCQDANASADEALQATNGATDNVRTIAAATTELSASINEIASRMSESARSAEQASTEGKAADSVALELVRAMRDIDQVVSLISSVAEQTNLLALNATIEAARAGDLGRGFSIVASEVKELAAQTSSATENVSGRITEIRAISQKSQTQMQVMLQMVERIKQFSMAVAAAAEQQSTATNSIAENVHSAAERAEVALASVHAMSSVTERAREATRSVQQHARSVDALAEQLDRAASDFLTRLKAA